MIILHSSEGQTVLEGFLSFYEQNIDVNSLFNQIWWCYVYYVSFTDINYEISPVIVFFYSSFALMNGLFVAPGRQKFLKRSL